MQPYSDNLLFMDTEFTDFDIRRGELLSIGMIKMTGEELYLELEYSGDDVHPWVEKNVLPHLKDEKVSKEKAIAQITTFIGDESPYMVAYVNQFDAVYWYDLFGGPQNHPAYWIPIDFASMLFASGYSPNSLGKHTFFNELGIDKSAYNDHHALDDAKQLRDIYIALMKKNQHGFW